MNSNRPDNRTTQDILHSVFAVGAWRSGQHHWNETGDVGQTAAAAVRGGVRWYLFAIGVGLYFFYSVALVFTPVAVYDIATKPAEDAAAIGVTWWPEITSAGDTGRFLLMLLIPWALTFLAYPFGLGVLWVRFADRSLFRVNRNPIYRCLLPFAYLMRRVPDWVLWCLPIILWTVGGFAGSILGHALAPMIDNLVQ